VRSLSLITLLGFLVASVAYFSMDTSRLRPIRRNLFVGRAFSRLMVGQYLRKLRIAK
jgi:hypothetical protein